MSDKTEIQKIMAVSLVSRDRVTLRAAYDGMTLLVVSVMPIKGSFFAWSKDLVNEIKEAQADGWSVLIEEIGDKVSQHATPVLLSDPHIQEDRPMLAVALDHYFAMLNSETVRFQPGTEQARIQESVVDVSTDDRGRNKYNIDWGRIKGAQRALILACLAAEGFQPLSESFINELFEAMGNRVDERPASPLKRIAASLEALDLERERKAQIKMGVIDDVDQ